MQYLSTVISSITYKLVSVTKTKQKMGQYMYYVRFKQSRQLTIYYCHQ